LTSYAELLIHLKSFLLWFVNNGQRKEARNSTSVMYVLFLFATVVLLKEFIFETSLQ
jgi:hypothetical protein